GMASDDDDLEEEGLPQLYDPPPGQDLDTDQTAVAVPRDRPTGATDWGTTAAEERIDEPLYRRVRREVPDVDEPGAPVPATPLAPAARARLRHRRDRRDVGAGGTRRRGRQRRPLGRGVGRPHRRRTLTSAPLAGA